MENQILSKKPLFNLSVVLQETGIKADTLRAWERRYQLPTPSRTEGGHRLFSAYDIETIKWLLARQNEGLRISQAVDYWRDLIAAGTDPLASQTRQSAAKPILPAVDNHRQPLPALTRLWIDSALNFDEENAERVLDEAFARFPWEAVCTNLIAQGLSEIGDRWYSGEVTVQQEHFASELVVKKLQALTATAPPHYHSQKVLISCPPGEFHAISPLMINMLLRYRGWETIYLGANVPDNQLLDALDKIQPALVIMTAARLTTSASLLETSKILQSRGIPLAFGGNVFSIIPELVEKIPGTYLGTDLGQSESKIESLLSAPETPLIKTAPPNPYLALLNEFRDKLARLENRTMQAITEEGASKLPHTILADANNFLFEDILAALTLGDLNHLRPNMEWIKGLLDTHEYDRKDFTQYIQSLIEVSETELSNKAQPLLAWLKVYLEELG
jgi:methanogenic corrinoid protein MtbC1